MRAHEFESFHKRPPNPFAVAQNCSRIEPFAACPAMLGFAQPFLWLVDLYISFLLLAVVLFSAKVGQDALEIGFHRTRSFLPAQGHPNQVLVCDDQIIFQCIWYNYDTTFNSIFCRCLLICSRYLMSFEVFRCFHLYPLYSYDGYDHPKYDSFLNSIETDFLIVFKFCGDSTWLPSFLDVGCTISKRYQVFCRISLGICP